MTSSMSNPPGGRNPPKPPGNGPLTCERYSSYLVRFSASPRTSYASATALNFSCFLLSPGLESGWFSRASLR